MALAFAIGGRIYYRVSESVLQDNSMKIQFRGQNEKTVSVNPKQTIAFDVLGDDGQPLEGILILYPTEESVIVFPPGHKQVLLDISTKLSEWLNTLGGKAGNDRDFALWILKGEAPTFPITLNKGDEGIDISHWQGNVDWDRVVGAGKKFAIIKASEGVRTDVNFRVNWSGAERVKIMRGAYHFFRSDFSSESQARYFSELLKVGWGELAPALDVEANYGNLSRIAYTQALRSWLQIVEQESGKKPIIYTSSSKWREYTDLPTWASEYPLWVANYTTAPSPILPSGWKKYYIWQYSKKGVVAGISGDVDLNRYGEI
jgi:GH25 family lysozyme M1 (1,4-beta-N-acetylmuramidase)